MCHCHYITLMIDVSLSEIIWKHRLQFCFERNKTSKAKYCLRMKYRYNKCKVPSASSSHGSRSQYSPWRQVMTDTTPPHGCIFFEKSLIFLKGDDATSVPFGFLVVLGTYPSNMWTKYIFRISISCGSVLLLLSLCIFAYLPPVMSMKNCIAHV